MVDLSNSPYTTNRILEIPQDIKLELNNGTLTLKAGSKLYAPNGFEQDGTTPHFDILTVPSDITYNSSSADIEILIYVDYNTSTLTLGSIHRGNITSNFASGTTPPTTGTYAFYNTSNNTIKTYVNGSVIFSAGTFPIAKLTTSSTSQGTGYVTSIDQIFNGFGYIGSTVFALPMKGQSTTAVNADGTVTSTIWESTTVQTLDVSASGSVSMSSAGVLTSGFNEVGYTKLADVTYYDSRIQSVNFFDIGLVANTNASNLSKAGRSYLAGMGMPSDHYIDLTLGVSGTSYTAPANGWFYLNKMTNGNDQYISLNRLVNGTSTLKNICIIYQSNFGLAAIIPAAKGDTVVATYSAGGSVSVFRFVYTQGEN